jgi:hypothetical protein
MGNLREWNSDNFYLGTNGMEIPGNGRSNPKNP